MFRLRTFVAAVPIWLESVRKYRASPRSLVLRREGDQGFVPHPRGRVSATAQGMMRAVVVLCLAWVFGACGDQATAPLPAPRASDPEFTIDLRYWDAPPGPEQQERIRRAVDRWERLFRGGLPDAAVSVDAGCGPDSPAVDEVVDDILVFVRVIDIDALAESGPCKVRGEGLLPITATVWIDGPIRIAQLAPDFLESLMTHELGHALGFGTLWTEHSLLEEPALAGGQDPHFSGALAIAAFDEIGGLGYLGAKVPVEIQGGPGTADSHWRALVFGDRELMSPIVVLGANPLSRATAASMLDLGYDVDLSAADGFTLPASSVRAGLTPRVETPARPRLSESPARWSMTVTDRSGAIVREVARR